MKSSPIIVAAIILSVALLVCAFMVSNELESLQKAVGRIRPTRVSIPSRITVEPDSGILNVRVQGGIQVNRK